VYEKKIFAPTIYPIYRDVTKVWFVQYRDATGKVVKSNRKLAHFSTQKEKLKEAKRLIKKILQPENLNIKQREGLISILQMVLDEKRYSIGLKSYQTYFITLKNLVSGTI